MHAVVEAPDDPAVDRVSRSTIADTASLRFYPADDDRFVATAARLLARGKFGGDGDALELRLRLNYPDARVSVRRPPGRCGGRAIWYLFRDGHFGG